MALISSITLDETVTMSAGVAYGLLVAKASEVTAVHPLVTAAGASKTVMLQTPVDDGDATAPAVGDSVAFGELGAETIRVLVRDIEPTRDLEARLTLVPEAAAIHSAGDTLPDFDPGITPARALPAPVVEAIRSDATAMIPAPDGSLVPRVIFTLAPIDIGGATVLVTARISGTDSPFAAATTQSQDGREVAIVGVEEGEVYDFRLFHSHPDYFLSPPGRVDAHTVSGSTDIPGGLTGVVINAIGGNALLRWDRHPAADVQIGGRILWRWSPETDPDDAEWPASVGIGKAVDGGATHAYLPLKPGTYLARVFDSGGRGSDDIAKVATKQASALTWSPVLEVVEHPAFAGTLTDLTRVGSTIKLDSGSFDDVPSVDALPSWDDAGVGVAVSGTYDFAAGMNLGAVRKVRLTSHIAVATENVYDLIDDWPDIDSRDDIDGVIGAPVDAWVEVSQTDDDPAGSPTWGPWERIDAGEVEAFGLKFREIMSSDDRSFNLINSELSVIAEEIV